MWKTRTNHLSSAWVFRTTIMIFQKVLPLFLFASFLLIASADDDDDEVNICPSSFLFFFQSWIYLNLCLCVLFFPIFVDRRKKPTRIYNCKAFHGRIVPTIIMRRWLTPSRSDLIQFKYLAMLLLATNFMPIKIWRHQAQYVLLR